jgi:hypothetical protein
MGLAEVAAESVQTAWPQTSLTAPPAAATCSCQQVHVCPAPVDAKVAAEASVQSATRATIHPPTAAACPTVPCLAELALKTVPLAANPATRVPGTTLPTTPVELI